MVKNNILKVFKKGRMVKRYESANKRRFFHYTRLIAAKMPLVEVYLKVIYGRDKDQFGRMTQFYNDGEYTDKHEFLKAVRAFHE